MPLYLVSVEYQIGKIERRGNVVANAKTIKDAQQIAKYKILTELKNDEEKKQYKVNLIHIKRIRPDKAKAPSFSKQSKRKKNKN